MCMSCGTSCPKGIIPLGTRNAVLPGYTDRDETRKGVQVEPKTAEQVALYFEMMQARYARLQSDQLFDHSHPVDDYAPQGMLANGTPAPGSAINLNIPTDYDMPVRYTSIAVLVPAGCLTLQLQLGQRVLQLRTASSGTDIGNVQPAWMNLTFTGIIVNSDDPRVLTGSYAAQATTTPPTEPFVSLTGFALTRGQYS